MEFDPETIIECLNVSEQYKARLYDIVDSAIETTIRYQRFIDLDGWYTDYKKLKVFPHSWHYHNTDYEQWKFFLKINYDINLKKLKNSRSNKKTLGRLRTKTNEKTLFIANFKGLLWEYVMWHELGHFLWHHNSKPRPKEKYLWEFEANLFSYAVIFFLHDYSDEQFFKNIIEMYKNKKPGASYSKEIVEITEQELKEIPNQVILKSK